MAKPKRTKVQRENDLLTVSQRYLSGVTQFEIAQELGVSQQQVSYDIKALQRRWQESALVNVDEAKAKELAKIDRLEREYWNAWERSLEDAEVQTTKQKGVIVETVEGQKRHITPVEGSKRVEGQSGNPAFLKGVEWCINKRCEILGLDAPKKVAPTNPGGDKPYESGNDERYDRSMSALADAIRESIYGKSSKSDGKVDTT